MKSFVLKRVNVTVVYDDLSEVEISKKLIKDSFGDNITVIDASENNIILNFGKDKEEYHIHARYSPSRLYVNSYAIDGKFKTKIKKFPLKYIVKIVMTLNRAINGKVNIKAYGFNYEGVGELDKHASIYFKKLFMNKPKIFEDKFKGKVSKFAPRFLIEFKKYNLTIDLEPGSDEYSDLYQFSFNAHFSKTALPSKNNFVKEIINSYNKSLEILNTSDELYKSFFED